MRSAAAIIIVVILLIAASLAVAYYLWVEVGEAEISVQGMIALGVGAVLTLGLGVGLMSLVFFSHRRGFDDEAGRR